MKTTMIVDLNKDLSLEIEGEYYKSVPSTYTDPEDPSSFEIDNIEIVKGTTMDFMEWSDDFLWMQIRENKEKLSKGKTPYTQTLFEYLQELVLQKLNY